MAKPAATVGSNHICPKSEGNKPHVGGAAIEGSFNVIFGGKPALRKGDTMLCIGPVDAVKSGSSSVFINGKAAARMGDTSNHGGLITDGIPTILIG